MEGIYLRGYQRIWWPDERSCRSRASGGASLQDQLTRHCRCVLQSSD
jgi:hypothetical protein